MTSRIQRICTWITWIALSTLLVGCAVVGYLHAFCTFNPWDDEGYFMLALRAYRDGAVLYDEIHTVFYGPVYFECLSVLCSALGGTLDHAAARWFMIGGWVAAFAVAGFAAWRLVRNAWAVVLTWAAGVPFVVFFANEPLHATSVVLPSFVPLLVLVVTRSTDARPPSARVLAICGALCAAIALVKLNVGVFVTLAFCAALAGFRAGASAKVARVGLALAIVVLPLALMRPLLSIDWVATFASLVALSAAPFAWTLVARNEPPGGAWTKREWGAVVIGGFALGALAIGVCLAHGTTLSGIWRGLVTDAAAFALTNHASPNLPSRLVIAVCVTVTLLAILARARPPVVALLRFGASAALLSECLLMRPPFATLPLVWLVAGGAQASRARAFLGLATVLLALQAYPIPGSQVSLFSFVGSTIAVVGAFDAAGALPWGASLAPRMRATMTSAFAIALVVLTSALNPVWSRLDWYRDAWVLGTPVGLPGTRGMLQPEMVSARLQWFAANLRHNADTFVGVPGLHSFHAWTGLAPPLRFYAHHWALFRRADEETALAHSLTSSARAAVVRNAGLVEFWTGKRELPEGPVKRAIDADYVVAGVVGDDELLFRIDARPELVLTAETIPDAKRPFEYDTDVAMRGFTLPALPDAHITRFVLSDTKSGAVLLDTGTRDPVRRLLVVNASGTARVTGADSAPIDTRTVSRWFMLARPSLFENGVEALVLRAYESDGKVAARILLRGP